MGDVFSGRLNQRVTLQRKVDGTDDWGQPTEAWVEVFTTWASIKTINGSGFVNQEFAAGDTEVSRATASIRMRFRDDIDAAMRVMYRGKAYDIKVVLPDEVNREFVDLGVAVGANQG